jgi:hypothetical protein
MANMQKKMAAALAAVNAYLAMEESAAAGQQLQAVRKPPEVQQSAWAQSGRQEMMTMSQLIQLRTFANFR